MRQNGRILFQGADDIPDFFRLQVACFCQGQDNPPDKFQGGFPAGQGQKQDCLYIYLIAKGTVDTKVLRSLRNKIDLAKMLVDDYRHGKNPYAD